MLQVYTPVIYRGLFDVRLFSSHVLSSCLRPPASACVRHANALQRHVLHVVLLVYAKYEQSNVSGKRIRWRAR